MYKIIGANQVEYGPITADQMRQWIAEGRANAQTLAQAEGETGWRPLSTFPEFASSFPVGAPPSMPGSAPVAADGGRAAALDYVSGPAIGLIVTGALGIAAALFRILSILVGFTGVAAGQQQALKPLQQQNPQLANLIMAMSGTAGVVLNVVMLLVCIFIIWSAVKMKKLESFGLVMTGTILAMLPCCSPCCCIGLPIGIWALVMLNKPEVRANFH